MKFKFWNLALVGYFQVSVSGKLSEIEDIGQYTIRSRHSQFREKICIKSGWKIQILYTFQMCEITELF